MNSHVPDDSYKARRCKRGISDERRNKEKPQNLNASVVALLQLSKCLMCASADKAAHSFPNILFFYFSVPVMDGEKVVLSSLCK